MEGNADVLSKRKARVIAVRIVECMLQFVSIHREVHSMVSPSWGVVFR
jgi:hypothetical protein